MAFTEFYVQTTGSNLNAGSTTADAAAFTYASGNWVASTGVFTVASGDPASDGVAVGDFASVYPDGSTVGVFVGRVTARDATTITVSLTAKSGTAPTDGTGDRTLKVGGAWKGPNAAEDFPFGFAQATMTNSTGNVPRVNIKSGVTYAITAAISHANVGELVFQGYTTSVGDGGRATIDGTIVGASYVMLTLTSAADKITVADLIFQNNGTTGSAAGVNGAGDNCFFWRCVVNNIRGNGLVITDGCCAIECEAYTCQTANSANGGGFVASGTATFIRCISHDNTAGNANGFSSSSGGSTRPQVTLIQCIADTNGNAGFRTANQNTMAAINCDFYKNGGDGIEMASATGNMLVENCNFIDNTGDGIDFTAGETKLGFINNCGFGAGTMANASQIDTANAGGIIITGSVTYGDDLTPWTDPDDGDFSITLAAALSAGRGAFTETAAGYAGTAGAPCIGAAQPSASGTGNPTPTQIAAAVLAAANAAPIASNVKQISDDSTAADNLESACDNYSATRGLTGTALPAVAAGSNGGVPLVGTQVPNATAGASNGLLISGTNSGTVTLGALTVSGATTLAAVSGTTLTFSGAVAFQSTFAVTTSTSLAALSCTTLTASGAVAFQSTFAVTGNVSMAAGLNITQSSSNTSALVVTGNGTGNAIIATSGSGANSSALRLNSGPSSSGHAFYASGGGSGAGIRAVGGQTGEAMLLAGGSISGNGLQITTTGASDIGISVDKLTVTGATTLTGAVSATNASNDIRGIDVKAISGDSAAADNLETAFDGGAYNVGGGAIVAASVTGAVGSVTGAVGSVTGAVGSVTGNVGGNVTGSVGSIATGGIVAASFGAGAIDAAALAADAGTEIAAAVIAATVETGYDVGETLRLVLSACTGVCEVSGNDVTFKAPDGTTTRIVSTTNAEGDRTAVVLTP